MRIPFIILLAAAALLAQPADALDAGLVEKLGLGDSDEKVAAINALAATGDPKAAELLAALAEGDVQISIDGKTSGKRVLVVKGDQATDAATGEAVAPLPKDREDVVANNRLRGAIASALAALKLDRRVCREHALRYTWARATQQFIAALAPAPEMPCAAPAAAAEPN